MDLRAGGTCHRFWHRVKARDIVTPCAECGEARRSCRTQALKPDGTFVYVCRECWDARDYGRYQKLDDCPRTGETSKAVHR
jgi:hypothetical protein